MATIYGITPEGFLAKPLSVAVDEYQTDFKGFIGDSAGTEADGTIPLDSGAGQLIVLLSDVDGARWDLLQAIVSSFDPNQASDTLLDQLCALTGTTREPETFSTVTITCTGTPLTVLNIGRVVKTSDTGARFVSLDAGTIAALSIWTGATPYAVGDRATNNNRAYVCITAGLSNGAGGPTTTASDITDGTVHWLYLGDGTGAVDVAFEAETAGPIGALAGTLTGIATPVSGWTGANNRLDASPGSTQETDPALRARREAELAGQGGSTADAIRAKILAVNEGSTDPDHQPPTTVTVFYNDTDSTDADGLPPHSVEVLVQGGTDQDIIQAIWESVGAGTATYGNQTPGTATDSEGNAQTVNWSRPVAVPMYVTATAQYDASQWPSGSDSVVAQSALSALLTYGEQQVQIGVDVRFTKLAAAMMTGPSATDSDGSAVVPAPVGSIATPGLLEISPLYFGTSPSPLTSTTVSISRRQIATFDSSRCTITASAETP
jgi:uncharacterized phage protein gp47/JayE